MKKINIKELKLHSTIIYYATIITSIIILGMFGYIAYLTYNLTAGTKYFVFTLIIALPVIISIGLMGLLLYTGKKKFYKLVKEQEF